MEIVRGYITKAVEVGSTTGALKRSYPILQLEHPSVIPHSPSHESISTHEINQIMQPLVHGLSEMQGYIRDGKYIAIIGDDTAGRIPALIIRGVVRDVNEAYGRSPAPTFFVKGSYNSLSERNYKTLRGQLNKLHKYSDTGRLLLVTEYMDSGSHIKSIGNIAHKLGWQYDIFAIARRFDDGHYRNYNVLKADGRIFPSVDYIKFCPQLHGNTQVIGYETTGEGNVKFLPQHRDSFDAARKDVRLAIATLINNIFADARLMV